MSSARVAAALAVPLGAVVGGLSASGLPLLLVGILVAAPVVLVTIVRQPELGVVLLAVLVYSRASDVAIEFFGAPSVLQPLLVLLLGATAYRAYAVGRLPTGLGLPLALFAFHGVVQATALWHARDDDAATTAVQGFARDAVIVLLVVALLRRLDTLRAALWTMISVGCVLGALGLYQYGTGDFGQHFGGFAQAELKNIAGVTDDYRISGPISDANHYAQMLVLICGLALGLFAARGGTRVQRGAAVVATGVLTVTILVTFSRGALLALLVLFALTVVARRPPKAAVGGIGVLILVLIPVLPAGYVDRFTSLTGAVLSVAGGGGASESSLSGRLSALQTGWKMFVDNPLIGVGVGQFTQYYRDYARGLGGETVLGGVEPHNLYVGILAETGLAGGVSFSALVVASLRLVRQGRRRLLAAGEVRAADTVGALALALSGFLLAGTFVHNAYPRFLWFLVALCLSVPQVVEDVLEPDDGSAPGLPPESQDGLRRARGSS